MGVVSNIGKYMCSYFICVEVLFFSLAYITAQHQYPRLWVGFIFALPFTINSTRSEQRMVVQSKRYCNRLLRFKISMKNNCTREISNRIFILKENARLYVDKLTIKLIEKFQWTDWQHPHYSYIFGSLKYLQMGRGSTVTRECKTRWKTGSFRKPGNSTVKTLTVFLRATINVLMSMVIIYSCTVPHVLNLEYCY